MEQRRGFSIQDVRTGLIRARDFVLLLWENFNGDGCRESAAALTYTTLFAIVPVMTVSLVILSSIPAISEKSADLQQWVFDNFMPAMGSQVVDYLQEFSRQAANLTGIGVLFLVVTSVLMLRNVERTMNRIWKVTEPRKGMFSFLTYWAILSLGPILLGAGIVMSSYVASMSLFHGAANLVGGMTVVLKVLPFFFSAVAFTVIYVVVPNCYVPWRSGVAGGVVSALLFELAKAGFGLFIANSPKYQAVYGAFAAVPLFLLWIFFSWMVFFIGAEVVRTLVVFREHQKSVPRFQEMLRLLYVFRQSQRHGQTIQPEEIRSVLRQTRSVRWDDLRNILTRQHIIHRLDDGSFALICDLRELTLAQLLQRTPWPAHDQLEVSSDHWCEWEGELQKRCTQARMGMEAPLDMSLAALFDVAGKEGDAQQDSIASPAQSA